MARRKRRLRRGRKLQRRGNRLRALNRRISHLEIQRQLKYAEYQLDDISFSHDVPYILTINNPSLGTNDVERIGDFLRNVRIQFNFKITKNASAANMFRVTIIHDYQNTITTLGQVFSSSGANSVYSLTNFDTKNRFKILFDRSGYLDTYHPQKTIRGSMLGRNILTRFSAGTDTILTGAIKLVVTSDTVDAATDPLLSGNTRVSYYDS